MVMLLHKVPSGRTIRLPGMNVVAEVVQHGAGSSTVLLNGQRTTWSLLTPVIYHTPKPIEEEYNDEPHKIIPKPSGKDTFGVKRGTKASEVNDYMLVKKKGISIERILRKVSGTVRGNVRSHLRRLTKDGFLTYNEDKEKWALTDKVK